MKKGKYYTFIISGNNSPSIKKFHVKALTLKICVGFLFLLFSGSLFLVSDYFHIVSNQFELQKTIKEKEELKKQFYSVENKLNELTGEVLQLRDFNRKIRAITTISQGNPFQKQYGKISSSPELIALATPSVSKRSPDSHPKEKKIELPQEKMRTKKTKEPASFTELVVSIDNLKEKTKLVKQNAWDLYSTLLKSKEVLNSTPSILPANGWITSHFGYRNETFYADHDLRFHRGLDIAADKGSPVFATASGEVFRTGYDDTGYGLVVVIDHGYGVKTLYAHMSEIEEKIKQKDYTVKRGEIIGRVGNTGKSTGPHLHYEIQISGVPVNPINYILNEDFPVEYTGKREALSL